MKVIHDEHCSICGCRLHRTSGTYERPTIEGRSHATSHHLVPERFFGRSTNRRGTQTEGIFQTCPRGLERETAVFCYECHEELLHNPVLLPDDLVLFARLVKVNGLAEEFKSEDRSKLAGRVRLFHDALARGFAILAEEISSASTLNDIQSQSSE